MNITEVLAALEDLVCALPMCEMHREYDRATCNKAATHYYDEFHYCEDHAKQSMLTDITPLPYRDALLKALEVLS